MGLKDKKLSEKLQLNPKLTLEKAVTQARQSETVEKQQDILQGTQPDPPSANVEQISKNRGKGGKGKDQKDKPPKSSKLAGKTPETKCTRQGPTLRLTGGQCDQKLSVGDQKFRPGRQQATNLLSPLHLEFQGKWTFFKRSCCGEL